MGAGAVPLAACPPDRRGTRRWGEQKRKGEGEDGREEGGGGGEVRGGDRPCCCFLFLTLSLSLSPSWSLASVARGIGGSARISVLYAFMFDRTAPAPCSTTGRGSGEIRGVWLGKSQLDMISSLQMLGWRTGCWVGLGLEGVGGL